MRARTLKTALLLALALLALPALAQTGRPSITCSSGNVTLTTTTEKVIVSSDLINTSSDNPNVMVLGWAQLTTGTNTTTVIPMIRRGTGITGTALTEANAETILATAGSTEPYYAMAAEQRSGVGAVQYSFTLKQAGSDGDGTALQACIAVWLY